MRSASVGVNEVRIRKIHTVESKPGFRFLENRASRLLADMALSVYGDMDAFCIGSVCVERFHNRDMSNLIKRFFVMTLFASMNTNDFNNDCISLL